eukprot:573654-Rhodomonas_salina.1
MSVPDLYQHNLHQHRTGSSTIHPRTRRRSVQRHRSRLTSSFVPSTDPNAVAVLTACCSFSVCVHECQHRSRKRPHCLRKGQHCLA